MENTMEGSKGLPSIWVKKSKMCNGHTLKEVLVQVFSEDLKKAEKLVDKYLEEQNDR